MKSREFPNTPIDNKIAAEAEQITPKGEHFTQSEIDSFARNPRRHDSKRFTDHIASCKECRETFASYLKEHTSP